MTKYISEEEAIKNAPKDNDYFVEDFSGKNCDDCEGWTTEDRRCVCGNRRVYWATGQDHEGYWYAYAEAW